MVTFLRLQLRYVLTRFVLFVCYYTLKAVFVFWKVVLEKPLSKLSCVYLSLEKLVNGKHFPVKGKFSLVSKKISF
jgi:hypothetical protein